MIIKITNNCLQLLIYTHIKTYKLQTIIIIYNLSLFDVVNIITLNEQRLSDSKYLYINIIYF